MNNYSTVFKKDSILENIECDYYFSPKYSYNCFVKEVSYSEIKNMELLYRECMFALEEEFHNDLKEHFGLTDNQVEKEVYETSWNIVMNNHVRENNYICYLQKNYFREVYNVYDKIAKIFS